MRRVMLMLLATAATACASGPSLQSAVDLHNTYKHIVETADSFVAPLYDNAERVAGATFRDDEPAYMRAMQPYAAALNAMQVARQGEQLMQLAVSQWQAGADDGGMTKEVAACVAMALEDLAPKLAALPGGELWLGATGVLAMQIAKLAQGAACTPAVNELRGQLQ